MDGFVFESLNTSEIELLCQLVTLGQPFLLNDAFAAFNHGKLSRVDFYVLFFGLQTLGLVRIAHMPAENVKGDTSITYQVSTDGNNMAKLYKTLFMC